MTKSPLLPALMLAAAVGCDDAAACHLIGFTNGFTLTFQRDDWSPATYDIELEFERDGTPYTVTCQARVPVLEPVELDAGTRFVPLADDDAGVDSVGTPPGFPCTSKPTDGIASGRIGRALNVTVSGTPSRVDVIVRDAERIVVEQRVRPEYRTEYINGGPECSNPRVGHAVLMLE